MSRAALAELCSRRAIDAQQCTGSALLVRCWRGLPSASSAILCEAAMPHVLPRRRPSPMAAAATLTRLCGPWHTALPTTAQVGSQRSQLLRRRRGDAVREGCDASRRVALAHSRDLRACLQGEDGRNKLEAWGLLRLLVETEEVNEYHFSLVLQDGCDNVEAVRRLDGLIEESGVKPNHVLSTGLHAAWVEHGEFERAVQVLAVARRDGQLRSRVITGISLTTLSRMVQEWPHGGLPERACSLDADITAVTTPWDYLRELYTAGLAQPAHVAAVLRLCTSADTIDLLLREMRAHGLAPDVHFYTALHNAWLSVGEMADAVHAIEEAREALSHDPASEGLLSRTRSNALRDMLAVEGEQGRQRAWAYFYELQLRGIADIFQYGVMAELGCDSRQELFDLFHRKTLIPHAATYTTLHHVSFASASAQVGLNVPAWITRGMPCFYCRCGFGSATWRKPSTSCVKAWCRGCFHATQSTGCSPRPSQRCPSRVQQMAQGPWAPIQRDGERGRGRDPKKLRWRGVGECGRL